MRAVFAATAITAVLVLSAACDGRREPGVAQSVATVCTRTTCVPAGTTATPPTPDGTRPPTFTPTPTSTATTVRPTNTAVATVATVCTRSTCVPAGSQ